MNILKLWMVLLGLLPYLSTAADTSSGVATKIVIPINVRFKSASESDYGLLKNSKELKRLWAKLHLVEMDPRSYPTSLVAKKLPEPPKVDFDKKNIFWVTMAGPKLQGSFARLLSFKIEGKTGVAEVNIHHSDYGSMDIYLWEVPKEISELKVIVRVTNDPPGAE